MNCFGFQFFIHEYLIYPLFLVDLFSQEGKGQSYVPKFYTCSDAFPFLKKILAVVYV